MAQSVLLTIFICTSTWLMVASMANSVELSANSVTSVPSSNALRAGDSTAEERVIVKRAPNGFTGMRGKKDHEQIGYNWQENLNPLDLDYAENSADLYESAQRYKKAPSAFNAVRGKKYTAGTSTDFSNLVQLIKRLEQEQLRKNILQDFIERLSASSSNEMISKRVPTGFTGMRGKRPELVDNDGMLVNDGEEAGLSPVGLPKRAPVNSFLGVRGKKDVSHQALKRSAAQAFDSRGKKQRFVDFSNKFVAVRGKKNDYDDGIGDGNAGYENAGQLTQSLADANNVLNYPKAFWQNDDNKRAPSGFLGMRGKRAVPNLSHFK